MALSTIINLILAVVIIACAWIGFKEGIIMGVVRILVIVLALYGGQLFSNMFYTDVTGVLQPFVSGYMSDQVEDVAYQVLGYTPDENGDYNVELSLDDLLEKEPLAEEEVYRWSYSNLGLSDSLVENLTEKTVTYANTHTDSSVSDNVVQILCQSIVWYLSFLLMFIILFALLTVIVNIPNLSFRIPYIGLINDIGGLGIGLFIGFMFCSIAVWVLQFVGLLLPDNLLHSGGLVTFFLNRNMLASYITF